MVNVEGQCKLPGYSNPKKHWQNLKDDLQLLKNWINFPFAASLVVLRSALEWKSWLTKLWSENIFHHVIFTRHSYDQSTSRTNRPTTCYRRKLGLHSPWHWYSSVMFHYQAELITTFCLQYFQGVFFLDSATSRRTFEAAFPFQILPRSFSIWVENPKSESWEPHQWNIMLFWGVFEVWSQLQNKGAALVIVTSCRFKI